MPHIFVSYSRQDIEQGARIVRALAESSIDAWIDSQRVPSGLDWEKEIFQAIEQSDAFIFLLSPNAVHSNICTAELDYALKNNKRILPIVISDTDINAVPDSISRISWIYCRDGQDDFELAIDKILKTIQTDYEWLKYHTKLQLRALEWVDRGRDSGTLLRGRELAEAEQQLARAYDYKDPQPTDVQRVFLLKSREQEEKRRRTLVISMTCVLIAFIGMLAYTIYLSRQLSILQAPANSFGVKGSSIFDAAMVGLVFVSMLTLAGIIYIELNSRNQSKLLSEERKQLDLKAKLKVFLCHSSDDKTKVRLLYNRLKLEKGLDPWLDTEKLLPGMDWDREIKSEVKASHVVIVCLSRNSISKEGYIQKEIKQALDVADEKPDGTIFLIPLRLENCEVPDRLQRWQWLDLFEKDSYDKLLISLRKRADDLAIKNKGAQ